MELTPEPGTTSLRYVDSDNPLVLASHLDLRVILSGTTPVVLLDNVGRTEELAVGALATVAIPAGEKLTISPIKGSRNALVYIRALTPEAAAAASAPVPKAAPSAQYDQSLSLGGAVLTTRTDREDTTQPSEPRPWAGVRAANRPSRAVAAHSRGSGRLVSR